MSHTKNSHTKKSNCNCSYKNAGCGFPNEVVFPVRSPIVKRRENAPMAFDVTYGLQVIDYGLGRDAAYSIRELSDGYVLSGPVTVPGSHTAPTETDFGAVKVNKKTGQVDPVFGLRSASFPSTLPGTSGTDVPAVSLVVDNNVLVAGSAQFGVLPANSNQYFAIAKFTNTGSLATDYGNDAAGKFNGGGLSYFDVDPSGVNDEIFGLAEDNKKRVVAVGFSNPTQAGGAAPNFNIGIMRYLPNGIPDPTFGVNGKIILDVGNNNETDDRGNDVIITDNGKIVVGARSKYTFNPNYPYTFRFTLARYNEDGTLDETFGNFTGTSYLNWAVKKGIVVNDLGRSDILVKLAKLKKGKIMAFGRGYTPAPGTYIPAASAQDGDFVAVRYHENGMIDTSFGVNGVVRVRPDPNPGAQNELYAGFIDHETDYIYMVGRTAATTVPQGANKFAIVRLTPNGSLDNTFGINGVMIMDFPSVLTGGFLRFGFVDKDGNVVVAGEGVRIGQTTADMVTFKLNPV